MYSLRGRLPNRFEFSVLIFHVIVIAGMALSFVPCPTINLDEVCGEFRLGAAEVPIEVTICYKSLYVFL